MRDTISASARREAALRTVHTAATVLAAVSGTIALLALGYVVLAG